jgi:predicted component of type VI protein secretion system
VSKRCPRCQTANHEGAAYCARCNDPFAAELAHNLCVAGRHPMDPGWRECPYCNAGASQAPRRQGFGEAPPRDETVGESFPPDRDADEVASPAPAAAPPARRRTVFDPGAADRRAAGAGGAERRRIVGLLVTYTWDPAGTLYPVREGRNDIGHDEGCDIRMSCDGQMSGRHATIVYRQGEFWVDDEKSMNGTFVGGDAVLTKQPLPDHARIQTGRTVWRFVALPAGPNMNPPASQEAADAER